MKTINIVRLRIVAAFSLLMMCIGCTAASTAFVVVSPEYYKNQIKRVALIGFEDYPGLTGSGENSATIFEKYLLQGGYSLVERRQINELMKERMLQSNGTYDQATIQKIGKILGVHALVFGSLNDYNTPREQTVFVDIPQQQSSPIYGQIETREKKGDTSVKTTQNIITGYNYSWTSQTVAQLEKIPAHVGISVRMVSVETGEVIWSASSSGEGTYVNKAMEDASAQLMSAVAKKLAAK